MKKLRLLVALPALLLLFSSGETKADPENEGSKLKLGSRCDYPNTGNSCSKYATGDACFAAYSCT